MKGKMDWRFWRLQVVKGNITQYLYERARKNDQKQYNVHIRRACMLWAEDYKRLEKVNKQLEIDNKKLWCVITVLERKVDKRGAALSTVLPRVLVPWKPVIVDALNYTGEKES